MWALLATEDTKNQPPLLNDTRAFVRGIMRGSLTVSFFLPLTVVFPTHNGKQSSLQLSVMALVALDYKVKDSTLLHYCYTNNRIAN